MKRALTFVCCLSICALFVEQASALDYSVHANTNKNLTAILATGEIKTGDVEGLAAFLRSQALKKNIAVYLASPGGRSLRRNEARSLLSPKQDQDGSRGGL